MIKKEILEDLAEALDGEALTETKVLGMLERILTQKIRNTECPHCGCGFVVAPVGSYDWKCLECGQPEEVFTGPPVQETTVGQLQEGRKNRAVVILEWDRSMGPAWINKSNLETLLYTEMKTIRGLLRVTGFIPPVDVDPEGVETA